MLLCINSLEKISDNGRVQKEEYEQVAKQFFESLNSSWVVHVDFFEFRWEQHGYLHQEEAVDDPEPDAIGECNLENWKSLMLLPVKILSKSKINPEE